jgi:predicted Zn-dependent peptidase
VGDVNPAEAVHAVTALFADAPPAGPAPAPAPAAAQARNEPVAVFRAQGEDEAHLVLGYATVPPGDPDRAPLEVLAEVLAGPQGPLAAALREEKVLVHDVSATAAGPIEPGYLAVAVSCAPARVDTVVAALRGALARVAASGVDAGEVGRAARRLGGARAIGLGSRAAVAVALARDAAYGRDLHAYRSYPAALTRVTADEVARAARRVLDPRHEVVAVVRPAIAAPARTAGAER